MKDLEFNHTKISLYTSIKELPIETSKKFQHYLLQDVGIGNTIHDVDEHLSRLMEFLKADKKDDAVEEAKNLRYNLFTMLSQWHFKSLSFACLVREYNGKGVEDYSPEGLNKLIDELSAAGLSESMVEDTIDEVKKNLIRNGASIFQSTSDQTSDISAWSGIT